MTTLSLPTDRLTHEPMRMEELGIDPAIVRDLALKTMFYQGRFTRAQLADALKVSVAIVDDVLHALSRDVALQE